MIRSLLAALALAFMAAPGSPALASTVRNLEPVVGKPWSAAIGIGLAIAVVSAAYSAGVWLCMRVRWPAVIAPAGLALIFFGVAPVLADPDCDGLYLDGQRPALTSPPVSATELCQSAFADLYDPARRSPIYAAETLTSVSVQAAGKIARGHDFRPDERLKPAERAVLRDYRASRFDRGHLAPAADQPSVPAESESFRLSNMVPQDKANNRGAWAGIEESVRTLAVPRFSGTAVHVVSGPIFDGPARLLKGRIPIPTRLFKAIFAPDDGQGNELVVGAWIVDNAAIPNTRFVSLDVLRAETGIDPFPSLSSELHAAVALTDGARKRTGVAESQ